MIKKELDQRVITLSKVLAKWISVNSNNKNHSINNDKLLFCCMDLVYIHDNWDQINLIYPNNSVLKNKNHIFFTLRSRHLQFKITNFVFEYPKPRYLINFSYFKQLVKSINTTINLINFYRKNKKKIATNYQISKNLGIPILHLDGDLILFDLVVKLRKFWDRRKLKEFLSNNIKGFDVNLLSEIIPTNFVELLPIYKFISSYLDIKEIHTWIMCINKSPLLFIKSLIDEDIKIIGYQHGGGYGFYYSEEVQAEFAFYDEFKFWGYGENTVLPFRFNSIIKNNNNFGIKKYDKYKINLFLDGLIHPNFFTTFPIINSFAKKSIYENLNLNIVIHPRYYDYYVFKNFKSINEKINIIKGEKNLAPDNKGIYFVSIYSTLFWKVINNRICFICYSDGKINHQTNYHFKFDKLMQEFDLIVNFKDLIDSLSRDYMSKLIENNNKFYSKLYKKI